MKIKIYSFFSGAGFLDLGFEKAGLKIEFVNEYNDSFLSAYKYARENMGISKPRHGYYQCDINEFLKGDGQTKLDKFISDDKKNSIVGFIGGPPCPDFSIAGKNKGINGENGKLTTCYKKVILREKPDFFVFENVKGLWSTKKHREEYEKIKRALSQRGYLLVDKLVNSLEYGVPQDRERIILFGIRGEICKLPPKVMKDKLSNYFNWNNIKMYSVDLINQLQWPKTTKFIEDGYLPQPKGIISELTIQYWFEKNNVDHHVNAHDFFVPRQGLEKFNTILEGDVRKKSFKRLHRWRYSPTVAYGNNEVHLHPYRSRRLSVAEALAIQSLPIDFIINPELSLTDKFKTIGNGVPFMMSNSIAMGIKSMLEEYVDYNNIKDRNK